MAIIRGLSLWLWIWRIRHELATSRFIIIMLGTRWTMALFDWITSIQKICWQTCWRNHCKKPNTRDLLHFWAFDDVKIKTKFASNKRHFKRLFRLEFDAPKCINSTASSRGGVKAWHAMPHWAFPIRTSAPSLSHVRSKIAIIVSIINRFMTSMTYALRDLSDTFVTVLLV